MKTKNTASLSESVGEPTLDSVRASILHHLRCTLARHPSEASSAHWWMATSRMVQDLLTDRMISTQQRHREKDVRRIYYLSLEYLMGRLLSNNLYNAGVMQLTREALASLGQNLDQVIQEEYDMGLGNGGLGRLAACFLDSIATMDLPGIGYGIRYQFGLFRQEFQNGYQIEHPDDWLRFGDPWEIPRPEYTQTVQVYGQVESVFDDFGRYRPRWIHTQEILGVPYDVPIAGEKAGTVNLLRLWESRSSSDLDFSMFNSGGYVEAVRQKNVNETISKVLYPNDATENGKELRLVQQYFFVTCSLRDIIRRYRQKHEGWEELPELAVIQLNDTHPALAIAELMRILHDEGDLPWEKAWDIVTRTFAYTNHTLLPEALEKWSVPLLAKVLPRHLQIIFEINRRHLQQVALVWPGDLGKLETCSLIQEGSPQMVRMAHLAVVGSFSVNGVAALHTDLLKRDLMPQFDALYPGKFNNKTNGITPRRWLAVANPLLAKLITEHIGDGWVRDLEALRGLEPMATHSEFRERFRAIKLANKQCLAALIKKECRVDVDPHALFDVQIKRLHEYKRQHLNLLHILALYRRLLQNPELNIPARVFIFAAKAAPGYDLAKTILKAINSVGNVINNDPRIGGRLKVVLLPNYRVSLAMSIIPAADLSEQISTAGKEASGTGNMKLSLNGALTMGTLDGANVEIQEEVGAENIFIFGHTVEEVKALRARGYNPFAWYEGNEELKTVVEWLGSDYFTPGEHGVLQPIRHSLLHGGDPFLVLADYAAYVECQHRAGELFQNPDEWMRKAILNTARIGKFSSDRTIADYNRDIWKLTPTPRHS